MGPGPLAMAAIDMPKKPKPINELALRQQSDQPATHVTLSRYSLAD